MTAEPHRRRVRHHNEPGHCHELTFSCYRKLNLLTNDAWRAMLSESIDAATLRHGYCLSAFVFMPNHVHLLIYPEHKRASEISRLIWAIKRPFSTRVKESLEKSPGTLLQRLTVKQRPGVCSFRYWQEGPGYDRNIDNARTACLAINYIHLNPVRRGLVDRADAWQWSSCRWYQELPYSKNVLNPRLTALPAAFLDAGR